MTAKLEDTWIQYASRLDPAQCGLFLLSICKYQTDSEEPELPPELMTVFDLIRPELDRVKAKQKAQKASVNKRLACKRSANDLQTTCNTSANDLQTVCKQPAQTPPSSPSSSPSLSPNNTPTQPVSIAPAYDAHKENPPKAAFPTFADRLPKHLRTPEVMAKWQEWEAYRRKTKRSISGPAASRQISMLAEYSPDEVIAIIDESIKNDWQGLFPPKGNRPRPKPSDKPF